jgi:hypothetical protein
MSQTDPRRTCEASTGRSSVVLTVMRRVQLGCLQGSTLSNNQGKRSLKINNAMEIKAPGCDRQEQTLRYRPKSRTVTTARRRLMRQALGCAGSA